MQKTKQVTINPITCSKGHTFYPRVLSNGTITKYEKCIVRNCRVYLNAKRVKDGLIKRKLNLIHKPKLVKIIPTSVINERPYCKICNFTFYDEQNFEKHNKRLHQR